MSLNLQDKNMKTKGKKGKTTDQTTVKKDSKFSQHWSIIGKITVWWLFDEDNY